MMELFKEWKAATLALVVAASLTGFGIAADDRWLRKSDFQAWVAEERQSETLAAIRQLEIEINALEAELSWTENERKASALEERIRFLEAQIADLERQL